MLRKGLPRAFPGLDEIKEKSKKEGTQYKSRVFRAPQMLLNGNIFITMALQLRVLHFCHSPVILYTITIIIRCFSFTARKYFILSDIHAHVKVLLHHLFVNASLMYKKHMFVLVNHNHNIMLLESLLYVE